MNCFGCRLILCLFLFGLVGNALAEESYNGEVAIEQWWGGSKIDGNREDKDQTLSFYAALETDLNYLPHLKVRYSHVDVKYTELEKYDYSLYYSVLEHDVLHFDLGLTLSSYTDTRYNNKETNQEFDFDGGIWSIYASGTIKVPNTNVNIIGQYDFADRDNKKMADFTAGLNYSLLLQPIKLSLRGGYRVMDYTFFKESDKQATVFIDGWFIGIQANF